jgi:DNA-binding GntR family transcriptional regulator
VSRQPSQPTATGNGGLLAERAYATMRDLIVTLRLPPGTALREDELMRDLTLGRTPLREAVKRLALEGLVEVRPRSGTYVTDIEATDIVHIAEVRAELEPAAARLAARRMDDRLRAVAAQLDAELEAIEGTFGIDAYMRLDERVHHFVWNAAGNPYLVDALERLWALSLRIWHLVLERVAALPAAVHEQRALLHALVAGDAALAEARMLVHVQAFETEIMEAFSR